jgi:hypothetical protein
VSPSVPLEGHQNKHRRCEGILSFCCQQTLRLFSGASRRIDTTNFSMTARKSDFAATLTIRAAENPNTNQLHARYQHTAARNSDYQHRPLRANRARACRTLRRNFNQYWLRRACRGRLPAPAALLRTTAGYAVLRAENAFGAAPCQTALSLLNGKRITTLRRNTATIPPPYLRTPAALAKTFASALPLAPGLRLLSGLWRV